MSAHGHPDLATAYQIRGWKWLERFVNGATIQQIADEAHIDRRTVADGIRKASVLMIEDAHQHIMKEIFPKAARVMGAALDREVKRIEEGQEPNLVLAERIMKAMFVFDNQSLNDGKEEVKQLGEGESEPDTLVGFVAKRGRPKQIKSANSDQPATVIDVTPESKHE